MGTEFKFLDILVMYLQIHTQAKRIVRRKSCKTNCMKIIDIHANSFNGGRLDARGAFVRR